MRKLVALFLLAACELQPTPKKQAPPPEAATPPAAVAPADAAVAVDAPPVDAGIEVSAECLEVAAKVVQVFIETTTDPAQKTTLEAERANMTRKVGEACTTQGWSAEARKCYLATKNPTQIKACETKFPPKMEPPVRRPAVVPGAAGAGSAAGTGSAAPAVDTTGKRPEPGAPRK